MSKTGFGLIGAGIVGGAWHAHVYHHMPRAELVAICDLNLARAQEVADRYGVKHVTSDYRDLLARQDIAAVSIATPDFAHREIAVAAAQAGKHILVEKPLATTVADAEAILQAVEAAGVKLMVDYHNRANPAFTAARQAVDAGELGAPAIHLRSPQQYDLRAKADAALGGAELGAVVLGQPHAGYVLLAAAG